MVWSVLDKIINLDSTNFFIVSARASERLYNFFCTYALSRIKLMRWDISCCVVAAVGFFSGKIEIEQLDVIAI